MQIRDLSETTGVQVETIRFYERSGVLPPARRAANGYRVYGEADVERLRFVAGARRLGLSLDEIAGILTFRDHGLAPCRHVGTLIERQIGEVEVRIAELQRLRADLIRIRDSGEHLPEDVNMQECICGLIVNPEITEE